MKYLFSGQEMKLWEKQAMETYKLPSLLLMERAAEAVVKELTNGSYDLHKVLVACGSGNNGGDGLAAARLLSARGIRTEVCMAGELDHITDETRRQLEMYHAVGGKFVTLPEYEEYTVIVDAIFGIGCSRELTGVAREVVEALNAAGAPIVAVDIPSGVRADNGQICGCAIRAAVTVTFFTEKRGMVFYPGREYCGRVVVETLGIPTGGMEQSCTAVSYGKEDIRRLLPKRRPVSHKGTYGKVLVMAGSPTISGAAYLAAAGAYRIGAGLVKIYTPKENLFAMQTMLPEALIEIYDRERPPVKQLRRCMEWADVIVIGPGFGTERMAVKLLRYVLGKSCVPVVIDADGLNILAKCPGDLLDAKAEVVLTPHIGEMERLTGKTKEDILKDPSAAARDFTETYPVTLVLKGAASLAAKRGETLYVNTSGNAGMATGGSGDVLAGMIGGLIGQGLPPFESAKLGVFAHGLAGDFAAEAKGMYSMTAADLLDGIAEVTKL